MRVGAVEAGDSNRIGPYRCRQSRKVFTEKGRVVEEKTENIYKS